MLRRAVLAMVLAGMSLGFTAPAQARLAAAPVSASLSAQLASAGASIPAFVHATTVATARTAAANAGLTLVTTWNKIGVAVVRGSASQIDAVRQQPGVTYVEGDTPIRPYLSTSHLATRGEQARTQLRDPLGRPVDGRGVAAAVIDTGVDGTHPFFRDANGSSAVRLNLKNVCGPLTDLGLTLPLPNDACFADLTAVNDTDTLSAGGHGTHVAGIIAGRDAQLSDGTRLYGAAPGATLIGLSVGAGLSIFGADSALNWVLDHHGNPCAGCPPIRVTNNSYGPTGGGAFDPNSATVKLQRALAAEGVLTVWAAGNDGPDNTATNPPGQDPTPGVIMVASYDDQGTGTRTGTVSDFSSRGLPGHPETYPDKGTGLVDAYAAAVSLGATPA